jgi:serine/threonine-protein kinase RsbW
MAKNSIEVEIKVPNQTCYLGLIGRIAEEVAYAIDRYSGDRETLAYHLNLVLTEAAANAMKYAHEGDPEKSVHISINITDDVFCARVYDQGQGFDMNSLPSMDFEKLEDRGRGIFIMKSLMDCVSYKRLGDTNVLEISKKLK